MNIIKNIIPTKANAKIRAQELFDEKNFSLSDLSSYEAGVLQESVDDKYVPALLQSMRARLAGLVIGAIAPYQFLLIGAVTLAASASATTGAWYSITLKEMKEKFESMGLNLTSKLLKADMTANSLSIYSGIGFAYKTIAYPEVTEAISNPTLENLARAFGSLGISITIHSILENILKNKEDSSVQFDFNDATLAGMTEEQQRFFANSISIVRQSLEKINAQQDVVLTTRNSLKCFLGLSELVRKLDVNETHIISMKALEDKLNKEKDNYGGEIIQFINLFKNLLNSFKEVIDFDNELSNMISDKEKLLEELKGEGDLEKFVAILHDIVPEILVFLEQNGEKGIKTNATQ